MPGVASYLLRRGVDRVILIFAVVTLQFILVRVLPTYYLGIDPSQFFLRAEATPEEIAQLRAEFGVDEPVFPNQYARYALRLFTGKFGNSFVTKKPVLDEVMLRLPNTLLLQGTGLIIITIIGLFAGVYSASRRGKRQDSLVLQLSVFSAVMPTYLMGIIFLLALGWYPRVALGVTLFPLSGTRTPLLEGDWTVFAGDYLWHLTLPLLSLVVASFGGLVYYVRNLTVSELGQDYVLTDRAKGMPMGKIMRRHVLRSVAAPVITNRALAIPFIIDGLIITEAIFGWYGMGTYLFSGLLTLDYPVVQAVFFMVSVVLAITLFTADVIISFIDPRIKLR